MRRKDREVSDIKAITDILDLCRTASIAMADEQTPYVVPLSYGYELKGDALILYFHCAKEGRKTDILRRNNRVCFTVFCEGEPVQTEIPCNCGYYFSSIIGNGTAKFIEDPDEKRYALGKMFEHQTGEKSGIYQGAGEFGCGEGRNAIYLARHGVAVEAFDSSEVAIKNAKRIAKESGGGRAAFFGRRGRRG